MNDFFILTKDDEVIGSFNNYSSTSSYNRDTLRMSGSLTLNECDTNILSYLDKDLKHERLVLFSSVRDTFLFYSECSFNSNVEDTVIINFEDKMLVTYSVGKIKEVKANCKSYIREEKLKSILNK